MTSENGEAFIKNLAIFVKTHEKALANAIQLRRQRSRTNQNAESASAPTASSSTNTATISSSFTNAFSLGSLSFTSQNIKQAKLRLTPHHLFYLLSRFEDLGVEVGSMNVRIESLHAEQSPGNYVSFLSQPPKAKRGDGGSIHSISSIRSVMSTMSTFWSGLGIGSSAAKTEKAQQQLQADTKYLYSAFTKIPCLRLSPDRHARLISGYEEFPFDTAVPLWAFKNLSTLEIYDLDFRQFFGWDRLSEQLRSLTIKRGNVEDPLDLIVHIVLDDMDKRRRRSSKPQSPPTPIWPGPATPALRSAEARRTFSFGAETPESPRYGTSGSPRTNLHHRGKSEIIVARSSRDKDDSPTRPNTARHNSSYRNTKYSSERMRRSGSESSSSSTNSPRVSRERRGSSNLLSMGILPASKWRFLRHLSLSDNSLTTLKGTGLAPLANTLQSLDLSGNLFTEVPDCLASLTALRILNLANCMIESLHSLTKSPLPAITTLSLRSNRLTSLAGIERLFSLERVDLRENSITDPTELARLTGIPEIRELFVLGNPMIRLHGHYRVTIFNLFRAATGYTEDILIDSTAPGYSERRQLKDRTTESRSMPVARPVVISQEPVPDVALIPSNISSRVIPGDRPLPHHTQTDIVVSSTRRKKITKRRIVDLAETGDANVSPRAKRPSMDPSQQRPVMITPDISDSNASIDNDSFSTMGPSTSTTEADPFVSTSLKGKAVQSVVEETITPPQTPPQPSYQDDTSVLANELENLKLSGNTAAYRQRLESLKAQFGPQWLQMLTDDRWSQNHAVSNSLQSHNPSGLMRTASQSTAVSPGRNFG